MGGTSFWTQESELEAIGRDADAFRESVKAPSVAAQTYANTQQQLKDFQAFNAALSAPPPPNPYQVAQQQARQQQAQAFRTIAAERGPSSNPYAVALQQVQSFSGAGESPNADVDQIDASEYERRGEQAPGTTAAMRQISQGAIGAPSVPPRDSDVGTGLSLQEFDYTKPENLAAQNVVTPAVQAVQQAAQTPYQDIASGALSASTNLARRGASVLPENPMANAALNAVPGVGLARAITGTSGTRGQVLEGIDYTEQALRNVGKTVGENAGAIGRGLETLGQADLLRPGVRTPEEQRQIDAGLADVIGGAAQAGTSAVFQAPQEIAVGQMIGRGLPNQQMVKGISGETPVLGGLTNPAQLGGAVASAVLPATAAERVIGSSVARAGRLAGQAAQAIGGTLQRGAQAAGDVAGTLARDGAEAAPVFGVVAPPTHPLARQAEAAARDVPNVVRVVNSLDQEWDDTVLGNAGYVKNGVIQGFHVTSDPTRAADRLAAGLPINVGRDEGKFGDLGTGLYMSDAPQLWTGRATGKWSFLQGMERPERERLAQAILAHPNVSERGYLTTSEREMLARDLRHFVESGDDYAPVFAAGQPYNIPVWQPEFLEPLGIKPGPQPHRVPVEVRGQFAELNRYPSPSEIDQLVASGVDGAFIRSGFASDPQLVVWNNNAVARFGDYTPATPSVMEQGQPSGLMSGREGVGSSLLGAAQRVARSSLPPGAAATQGQAAADLGVGAASGVYGAATAPEDATWQERLARGAEFGIAGTLAPGAVRGLAREAAGVVRPVTRRLGAIAGDAGEEIRHLPKLGEVRPPTPEEQRANLQRALEFWRSRPADYVDPFGGSMNPVDAIRELETELAEIDAASPLVRDATPRQPAGAVRPPPTGPSPVPTPEVPPAGPGAVARQTPEEAIDRVAEMYAKGQQPVAPSTAIERAVNDWTAKWHRAWFDQGSSIQKAQQMVYERLGRAPTAAENLYTLFRLYAGRGAAAGQELKDGLIPYIKNLSREEEDGLNIYLTLADNVDVAARIGARVAQETLEKPLPEIAGRSAMRRGEQSLRMRQQRVPALEQTVTQAKAAVAKAEAARTEAITSTSEALVRARRLARHADPDVAAEGTARLQELTQRRTAAQEAVTAAKQQLEEATQAASGGTRRVKSAEGRLGRIQAAIDQRVAEATAKRQGEAYKAGALARETRAFSGGVTVQSLDDVQRAMIQRYGPEKAQRIFTAAEHVWDFTKQLRRRLHASGMMDDETLAEWETAFPHYVKAEITKYLPEEGGMQLRGQGGQKLLSLGDAGFERLTTEGTTAARDKPLNSVIRQTFSVENQTRRNEMAQGVLQLIEADRALGDQSTGLADLFKPVLSRREAEARGLSVGQYVSPDHKLTTAEATFAAIVNGNVQEFVIPKTLEPLIAIDPLRVPDILHWVATAFGAPLMRATATTLNARFLPTNLIRDAQVYTRRAQAHLGASPQAALRELAVAYKDVFAKADIGNITDWGEALKIGAGQTTDLSGSRPLEVLTRLRRDGVIQGWVRPIDTKADYLRALGDIVSLPLRATVGAVGERIEAAPRLAAYRLAKQGGMDSQTAALWARDITMDFSRGGTFSKFANVLIPFFNVGMQAPERLVTLDLAKGARLQTAMALTTTAILPMAAAEAWNRSQYPEDYADVPDYLKNRGIVIMLPIEAPRQADGQKAMRPYLWLPTDPSLSFLNTVIRAAGSAFAGDDTVKWQEVLASIIGSVSPAGADAGGALSTLLPPVPQEAVEQLANYDLFRGRPIVPEALQNALPADQTRAGVNPLYAGIGGVLGQSPLRVEKTMRGLAPGVMNLAEPMANAAVSLTGGKPSTPPPGQTLGIYQTPVVGGLVAPFLRQTGGQIAEDARKASEAEEERVKEARVAKLEGNRTYQRATPEQQRQYRLSEENRVAREFEAKRKLETAKRKAAAMKAS